MPVTCAADATAIVVKNQRAKNGLIGRTYRVMKMIPSAARPGHFPLFSLASGPSIRGVRVAPLLFLVLLAAWGANALAQQPAPITEEEKRRQFLKAREEMHTLPPAP